MKKEQQISMEHLGDDLKIQRSIPSVVVISSCFYRPHFRVPRRLAHYSENMRDRAF
jgi:hypothetical protein